MARIDRQYYTSYQWCVVTVCLSRAIFVDSTTFTVYVIACRAPNIEKSFICGKQLRLKTIDIFPSMCAHSVVNTCHIHW